MTTGEDILQHYGVKGQKWGVRRKIGGNGKVSPTLSEDAKRVVEIKSKVADNGKSVKALSNKEIQDFITRTNLERQYTQMTKTPVQRGLSEATKMLTNIGKQQAVSYANRAIADAIAK